MGIIMNRIKYSIFYRLLIIWGTVCIFASRVSVYAQEAQVIYDFIEMTEDMPVFESPDPGSKTDLVIPNGEAVLVISETADGWYQILYHEEILYISNQGGKVEEAQISEEVVEEIEENKADQELTQEEIEMLTEDADGSDKDTEMLPKILLGIIALVVLLSGIGYFYVSKKEKVEEARKTGGGSRD